MLILVKSKTEGYKQLFYTIVIGDSVEDIKHLFEDDMTSILETWTDPVDIEYVLLSVYGKDEVFFTQMDDSAGEY